MPESGYKHNKDNDFYPRAKAEFASKRADGTTNTRPQERMRASGQRQVPQTMED
ncbi:small, acid-soluble spore protein K [Bacillus lacus]|uniref:Small, acid-soluble spore protein K n=1 Tax=Metabacillus lacus TaxID=1983721 RepID=A0A7X2J234_9BACI|nr:small, acid-soluble spore protein K [Metabacillus lacus]MRX73899.1 small, acid-soluble spore protein K [Metabacillus lacus]